MAFESVRGLVDAFSRFTEQLPRTLLTETRAGNDDVDYRRLATTPLTATSDVTKRINADIQCVRGQTGCEAPPSRPR